MAKYRLCVLLTVLFNLIPIFTASVLPTSLSFFDRQLESGELDNKIKSHGKKYLGVATDGKRILTGQNANIIRTDFGQLTPEYSLRWDEIEPSRNRFNWSQTDLLVEWAQKAGKLIRGPPLVVPSSLPDWVLDIDDRNELIEVMENHIMQIISRYRGKIYAWDVISGLFDQKGKIQYSIFLDQLGEDFVPLAFKAARAADPYARLYISDHKLDNPEWPKLKLGMVPRVKQWLADSVPINGIGMQAHLTMGDGAYVAGSLRALAGSGVLEVAVTELDVTGGNGQVYVDAIRGCLDVKKCVGVTIWGIRDTDSFRPDASPLLFDQQYKAKENYNAILNSL